MGRKLVMVETRVGGLPWVFGCVHLESYRESSVARGRQLEHVVRRLARYEHAALMGDVNFCATWTEENQRIPGEWLDVWDVERDGAGWTVDTDVNEMRYRRTGAHKQVRIDRVLLKSPTVRSVACRLVGTRPIPGEAPPLWPSDHFGVLAELRVPE